MPGSSAEREQRPQDILVGSSLSVSQVIFAVLTVLCVKFMSVLLQVSAEWADWWRSSTLGWAGPSEHRFKPPLVRQTCMTSPRTRRIESPITHRLSEVYLLCVCLQVNQQPVHCGRNQTPGWGPHSQHGTQRDMVSIPQPHTLHLYLSIKMKVNCTRVLWL